MTIKLNSLALLIFFLTIGYSHAEDQFLLPEKKPSVFKKIDNNIRSENSKNLPQKKPVFETDTQNNKKNEKKELIKKKIETKKIEKVLKKEVKPNQNIGFLLP